MKVILLKSVPKVGRKDEIVDVADGFAQHSLLPKKFAIPATSSAVDALKRRLQNTVAEREVQHVLLDKAITELKNTTIVMKVNANKEGSLFSKIHASDVVKFLANDYHITIDEAHLSVPEIKKLGSYEIGVRDEGYTNTFTIELTQ